jgi:vacuolar-type H+-ATPase subunit I/STV1
MCKFLLGLTYSKWFGSIAIDHSISTSINRYFNIYMNSSIDSSLTLILFGVVLIALSYLFKYGNKLEQEQALTI